MGQTLVQYILYQVQVMSYLIVWENILQSQKIHYQHSKYLELTSSSENISFETSFQSTSVNYINKVFGRSNFSKSRTDVPLFLEEEYTNNLLNTGYKLGKIRGLNCSLFH